MFTEKVSYHPSFETVRRNALLSGHYLLMNGFAAILAGCGLFTNQLPVLFGAMLISALIGPIIASAFALFEKNYLFLRKALLTEFFGILVVYIIGLFIGTLGNAMPITTEMLSRTSVTFIDFIVAFTGGAVGIYALLFTEFNQALVGVGLATALVPPITTSAIFIIHGDFILATGAFYIVLCNLLGIFLGAYITLFISNYLRYPIKVR